MKFIELTSKATGKNIYVNTFHIIEIRQIQGGGSLLLYNIPAQSCFDMAYREVTESKNEVFQAMVQPAICL